MPFIILCGFPCSGKTSRSLKLKEYFENEKNLRTITISEHDRGLQRNLLYSGLLFKDYFINGINQYIPKNSRFYEWRKPSWKCP